MPRRLTLALVALAAFAAVATLVWTQLPGQTVLEEEPAGPRVHALNASFPGQPDAHLHNVLSCEVCHYAWNTPFDVLALREERDEGQAAYSVRLAPVSGYNLTVVAAAPRAANDSVPAPATGGGGGKVAAPGGSFDLAITLPWRASVLLVEAWSADVYKRPDLRLDVNGTAGTGGRANKHVALVPAPGTALEGSFTVRVTLPDPVDANIPVRIQWRALPEAYAVVVDATRGRPAELTWALPVPGAAGAPERLHVVVAQFNDHPTQMWRLPVDYDRGYNEGNVTLAGGTPYGEPTADELFPPPFPARETCDALWGANDSKLLYQEAFDGALVSVRNARGEWTRSGAPLRADIPPESPFPALPPCTTHVKATLVWQKRTPVSPEPAWTFAYSARPLPDFFYPEPTAAKPGERVDIVPVSPDQWETTETGWFQAFYLRGTDAEGKALFDGAYTYRLEAFRSAPPAGTVS